MWFKTKAGLVHLEGSFELVFDRYTKGDGTRCVGIYAYKHTHPVWKTGLFVKKVVDPNRSIYIACFADDDHADEAVARCMLHIEKSVVAADILCDLSEFGDHRYWSEGWDPLVQWPRW